MAYKKVGWKDYPSTDTPINATNLDHMDAGILENAQTIGDKTKISGIGDGTVAGAIAANKSAIDANAEAIAQNTQSLTNINVNVGEDGKLHFVDSTGADSVIPFKSYNYDYYTGTSPFTKTFNRKPRSLAAICRTYATLVINGSIKYNQDNKINIDKNFSFYHNNCNGEKVYLVVFDYE